MSKYITCITRTLLKRRMAPAMTKCEGVDILRDTHCAFCEYYENSQEELDDEVEDPVIYETERLEWEESSQINNKKTKNNHSEADSIK